MKDRDTLRTNAVRQFGALGKTLAAGKATTPDYLIRVHPVPLGRGDILTVAKHFLRSFAMRYGKEPPVLSEDAAIFLARRHWVLADLARRLARAVAVNRGSLITAADLSDP